jgi:hypothetical protein
MGGKGKAKDMTTISLRPLVAANNIGRIVAAFALVLAFGVFMVEPAYAFGSFQSAVTSKTEEATDVAVTILRTAAVLALIVGLAPMLWGQIKVKWIVTALSACVLFGLVSVIVPAFATNG